MLLPPPTLFPAALHEIKAWGAPRAAAHLGQVGRQPKPQMLKGHGALLAVWIESLAVSGGTIVVQDGSFLPNEMRLQ